MRFFDGNFSDESNLLTEVSDSFYGSQIFPSNVSSSSNSLFVTFTSDESYRHLGFKLRIYKEPSNNTVVLRDACSMTHPCKDKQGHCQSDEECHGYLKCGNHNHRPTKIGYNSKTRCCYDYCSQWLDMENGVLTSPWYPKKYPPELRCRTLITVGMTIAGPRTITLEFLQFKVSILGLLLGCLPILYL